MGKPITTQSGGVCFAFPNVCSTPVGISTAPIPYPSVGQLSDVQGASADVFAGSNPVVLKSASIPTTKGDAAGTAGPHGGSATFSSASATVFANGTEIVRLLDKTQQNGSNANGVVLGGFASVLVGD
ncbi:MAG TPA: DUF4150 domain-containing protein [Burkholderiaceae bacterium]|nr:DUF4150 domain-containing protein [Burkholderiaceae bacterium]